MSCIRTEWVKQCIILYRLWTSECVPKCVSVCCERERGREIRGRDTVYPCVHFFSGVAAQECSSL